MQRNPYASVVGNFMYIQVCTRSILTLIVGILGRYLSNPGVDHQKAIKKVMPHLHRIKDYMLTYYKLDQLEIEYSDFARCQDNKRSTSSYIFLLVKGAISQKRVKKTLIAPSTMVAEFIAVIKHKIIKYGLEILSIGYRSWIASKDH